MFGGRPANTGAMTARTVILRPRQFGSGLTWRRRVNRSAVVNQDTRIARVSPAKLLEYRSFRPRSNAIVNRDRTVAVNRQETSTSIVIAVLAEFRGRNDFSE